MIRVGAAIGAWTTKRLPPGATAFALLSMLGGCAAHEPGSAGRVASGGAREQRDGGAALRTRVAFIPPVGSAWVAGLDANGDTLVVLGALRARVGVDDAGFGLQPFATEIALAVEVDDGWVFVARDGAVARSDVFTGALERLGDVGTWVPPAPDAPMSRGRLIALDGSGRAFGTDGQRPVGPFAPWQAPGTAIEAVFLDVSRGAAILDGGRLVVTGNGGESWRALDMGPAAATALGVEGDEIVVRSAEGELRAIGRDGASRAGEREWSDRGAASYPRGSWLRRMALWVFPELVESIGVATVDGRAAAVLEEDAVISVRPGSGRAISRVTLDASTCTLTPWGARVLVSCENRATLALDGTGRFREETTSDPADVAAILATMPDAILSDDGRHAVRATGCGETSDGTICVMDPVTRAWRATELPREITQAELVAMHGAELLISGFDPNRKPLLAVMNVDRGGARRIELAAPAHDPAARSLNVRAAEVAPDARTAHGGRVELEAPRFAADGTVHAIARADETGLVRLALGPSSGPLVLRAVPRGAIRAAMSDAHHGIASGDRPSELWETVDGARSWQPLSVPLEGRVASGAHLRWPAGSDAPGAWSCRRDACRLGRLTAWRVRDDGPRARVRRAMASAATLPVHEPTDDGDDDTRAWRRGDVVAALVCGDPEPVSAVSLPAFGAAEADATTDVSAAGARARIAAWRDGTERRVWQIAWSGADARGPFVRASTASPIPFQHPEADHAAAADVGARYVLRAVTRRGALVTRTTRDGTEHAWAPANGAVRVVLAGVPTAEGVELVSAEPAPDGGALLAWRVPSDTRATVTRVLRLAPNGATVGQRDLVTSGLDVEGIAWSGSTPGYVARHRASEAWVFFPLDPVRSPEIVPVRSGTIAEVCGESRGRLRVTVGTALVESSRWSLSPSLELDARGQPCVRAIAGVRQGETSASLGLWASGGALEGTAAGSAQSARLRCRLRPGARLVGDE